MTLRGILEFAGESSCTPLFRAISVQIVAAAVIGRSADDSRLSGEALHVASSGGVRVKGAVLALLAALVVVGCSSAADQFAPRKVRCESKSKGVVVGL